MFGKHHTPEALEKMSLVHKGQKPWNTGRKDVFVGEDNPFFGKKHSEESKYKMRIAHLGKIVSEETKQKLKEVWAKRKMLQKQNSS